MGGYIGARAGIGLINTTLGSVEDLTATDTSPEVTLINSTHEDTDGGREGKVIFKGQQSGGEESTLAEIQASHDGTADDEKGDLIFRTNDGSDGASPTEAMRITSNQKVGIGTNNPDELLELSAENDAAIKITSTNAGAAADDVFGSIKFESGDTSGTTPHIAGQISSIATDAFGRGRLAFSTGRTGDFAERMTIQSGGNVGIGTSSPSVALEVNGGTDNEPIKVISTDSGSYVRFEDDSTTGSTRLGAVGNAFKIDVNSSEAIRIDSSGNFLVGKSTSSASTTGFEVHPNGSMTVTRSSGSSYHFHNTANYAFYVNANGGIYNYTSNNVNLSDEREKKNIEALGSKWNAVKAWSLKEFHFNADEDSDAKKLGVIAQDLETNHPELIAEYKKTEDETRKSVKEQQMMWMAIKALQEAMAKIETLETKVAALEAE